MQTARRMNSTRRSQRLFTQCLRLNACTLQAGYSKTLVLDNVALFCFSVWVAFSIELLETKHNKTRFKTTHGFSPAQLTRHPQGLHPSSDVFWNGRSLAATMRACLSAKATEETGPTRSNKYSRHVAVEAVRSPRMRSRCVVCHEHFYHRLSLLLLNPNSPLRSFSPHCRFCMFCCSAIA